jgi:hypothetical protein
METDDSASTTSDKTDPTSIGALVGTSSASANNLLSTQHSVLNKLVDEQDDEGFFDKPAVSPASESGTSTPPPSSDPETEYIRNVPEMSQISTMINTT